MTLMRGSRFRTGWSFGFAEDLQFFGHTHAGQFFPLRLLYPLFTQTCGEYECDGAKLLSVPEPAGGASRSAQRHIVALRSWICSLRKDKPAC